MNMTNHAFEEKAIMIRPSKRQLLWQETEFYGFIHFSINTFTERQWGDGTESPLLFDPSALEVEEWVKTIKDAGMNGLILTCKHHDGFCLWPSFYTEYTLKNSPYKNGKGDIVKKVSEACLKHKIKFGIYISPWDRHDKRYGKGNAYNDYFCAQLEELLTNYGPLFSVWLDGACGEGDNGKFQYYDWDRYYALIRAKQPKACISVCGPDVRWCGNESGATREQEWSVVPEALRHAEKVMENAQQDEQHEKFINKSYSADKILGDRDALKQTDNWVWYPCEVNLSIRPSWFYTTKEDDLVKSADELFDLYIRTVGGNATLLLNIPPDKSGRFFKNDISVLHDLGDKLRQSFAVDILEKESATVHTKSKKDGKTSIYIYFEYKQTVNCFILQELIEKGQRVERFNIKGRKGSTYETVYSGKVIGYKHIATFETIQANDFCVEFLESRSTPLIKKLKLYHI